MKYKNKKYNNGEYEIAITIIKLWNEILYKKLEEIEKEK